MPDRFQKIEALSTGKSRGSRKNIPRRPVPLERVLTALPLREAGKHFLWNLLRPSKI